MKPYPTAPVHEKRSESTIRSMATNTMKKSSKPLFALRPPPTKTMTATAENTVDVDKDVTSGVDPENRDHHASKMTEEEEEEEEDEDGVSGNKRLGPSCIKNEEEEDEDGLSGNKRLVTLPSCKLSLSLSLSLFIDQSVEGLR
ncbi:hypothetical protein DITRI_Ditri15bG0118100 [Diplodiscus trichospermus]